MWAKGPKAKSPPIELRAPLPLIPPLDLMKLSLLAALTLATVAGTAQAQVCPNVIDHNTDGYPASSNPFNAVKSGCSRSFVGLPNGFDLFRADTLALGVELHRTQGPAHSTELLKGINPAGDASPSDLALAGSTAFSFVAGLDDQRVVAGARTVMI